MNRISKFFLNIGSGLGNISEELKNSGFFQMINNDSYVFDYTNLPKIVNDGQIAKFNKT